MVIIAEGEMEPTFIISWRIFPVDARSLSSPESLHDDPVIVLQLRVPVQQHDGDQEEAVDQGQHQPNLTNLKEQQKTFNHMTTSINLAFAFKVYFFGGKKSSLSLSVSVEDSLGLVHY